MEHVRSPQAEANSVKQPPQLLWYVGDCQIRLRRVGRRMQHIHKFHQNLLTKRTIRLGAAYKLKLKKVLLKFRTKIF